jgi:riboflavin kinase/FMN adenylyltransferase
LNSIKSITIGSFDGIHIAHQKLISKAQAVVVIEHNFATLTPGWKRSFFINKPIFFYHLQKIKNLNAKEFLEKLELDFPNLEKIVIGYDFKFGKDKSGDINFLKENFKGEIEVVSEVKIENISVHSRVIRKLIENNDIKLANKLLNRAYQIDGYQIKGLGLGSKELVPTINLEVLNYTLPNGVFCTNVKIENKTYKALCFVGNKKTINGDFSVELHILESFNKKFIKQEIFVEFLEYIRNIEKFNSLKELKQQINKDIKFAKNYFKI